MNSGEIPKLKTKVVFIYRYASVIAMESATKVDDEQWLAYWIIYSFLTLSELILQSALEWIPIWYSVKLVFVAWLVLPQFKGAAFIYNRLVREQFKKHGLFRSKPTKQTFLHSVFPHRVYTFLFSFFPFYRRVFKSGSWSSIRSLFRFPFGRSFDYLTWGIITCLTIEKVTRVLMEFEIGQRKKLFKLKHFSF